MNVMLSSWISLSQAKQYFWFLFLFCFSCEEDNFKQSVLCQFQQVDDDGVIDVIDRVVPYVVESFLNQLPPGEKVGGITVHFQFAA